MKKLIIILSIILSASLALAAPPSAPGVAGLQVSDIGVTVQAYDANTMKKAAAALTEGQLTKSDSEGKLVNAGAPTTGLSDIPTGAAVIKTGTSTIGQATPSTSDGTFRGITLQITAHENVAFGQLVFINSDGEAALADADAAATMPAVGIVVVAANADATCTILTHGVVTETDWNWTPGSRLYVSETAGSIEATLANISDKNDVVQVIGVALTADTILFNPSLTEVVLE